MSDHMHHPEAHQGAPSTQGPEEPSFWRSKYGIVLLGFGIIAAFFLLSEHWAHALGILPFLLILACPLMHIFMHGRHGGHGGHHNHGNKPTSPNRSTGQEGTKQ